MPKDNLRFGLVGYGLWGRHHAQAIVEVPGAELAAVAERSEGGRAAAEAACPDVDISSDYRQMIRRDDIDVVDVVVPNYLHYEVGKAVLAAGKHLLLEKPMTLSVQHADELIALAEQEGKVLAVNHEMRLSALWGKVKQLIDQRRIGDVRYVLVELSRFPYRQGSEGWRYDIDRVGNWILEEPIHYFDLARWYLSESGDPVSVYARANSASATHPELQDNFTAIVNFEGGAFAVITETLAAFEHHVTCKVTGTDGAIWARWSGADARTDEPTFGLKYSHGAEIEIEEVSFAEVTGEIVELKQQIAALVRSVQEGVPPEVSGIDGKWSVQLCLAAQQSVETSRVESLESGV